MPTPTNQAPNGMKTDPVQLVILSQKPQDHEPFRGLYEAKIATRKAPKGTSKAGMQRHRNQLPNASSSLLNRPSKRLGSQFADTFLRLSATLSWLVPSLLDLAKQDFQHGLFGCFRARSRHLENAFSEPLRSLANYQ